MPKSLHPGGPSRHNFPLTYLFTWLSDRSGGSVPVALVFHASINACIYQYRQAQVAQLRAAQAEAEAQAPRDAAQKALRKVEAAAPQAEQKAVKQAAPGAPRRAEEKGQGKKP